MNRLSRLLFGHLRLSPEERESTERLRRTAMTQHTEAQAMARRVHDLKERNHFGERIRQALTAAEGDA